MELEVKEMTNQAAEAESTLADAATGAVVALADAASHPVRTVRREVRRLERQGAPVNRQVDRSVKRAAGEAAEFTEDLVGGTLPERWALTGIRMLKDRARRKDTVGDLLFRGLEAVNDGLERYLKTVQRFESATEPPSRGSAGGAARRPARSRSSAARSRSSARASAKRTASKARSTARSAQATARKTAGAARKSA